MLQSFGRLFLTMGLVLVIIGLVLIVGEKFGLGKLPGDIYIKKGSFTVFFPIVSSLIISLLLTILLNVIIRR
ncbi:MAG: DUF2905 domain-containing protein [Tissierellia bacterium]|nr:DUF2905 domain-containing protein [Tissierellia bacterium]